jgi:hypothetical protein
MATECKHLNPRFLPGMEVGFKQYPSAYYGEVFLVEWRDGQHWYLIDEHPHVLRNSGGWVWVPNSPYTGQNPGMIWCAWWPDEELTERISHESHD